MTPEAVREWFRIAVDFVVASIGAFMLIHETVAPRGEPNLTLIGAGIALLGVPPSLRLDSWKSTKKDSDA